MRIDRPARCVLLAALLMGASACGGAQPAATAGAPTAKPAPAPDESVPLARLTTDGYPPPDRVWTGPDYTAAAEVLARVLEREPKGLPVASSAGSGPAFARLVAPENIAAALDPKMAVTDRVVAFGRLLTGISAVQKLYVVAQSKGAHVAHETMALVSFLLRTSADAWPVLDAFIASLDPKDPTYAARMDGLGRVRAGTAEMLDGALGFFSERSIYGDADTLVFARDLEKSAPALVHHLTPQARAQAIDHLRRTIEAERVPAIKQSLEALARTIAADKPSR